MFFSQVLSNESFLPSNSGYMAKLQGLLTVECRNRPTTVKWHLRALDRCSSFMILCSHESTQNQTKNKKPAPI